MKLNKGNDNLVGIVPFLKWAGGKQWLAPALKGLLAPVTGKYIEPFLGGGAVFFSFLPERAWLSDSNGQLVETYLAVRDDANEIIDRLMGFSFTRECYYRVKQWRPRTRSGRAARFIYLNRTCWNGLYRVNRNGEFNVPMGAFERTPDFVVASRLKDAQRALRAARIACHDFENACKRAAEGDTVYLDPPYTVAHSNNGFRRYNEQVFSWRDQLRLARVAHELRERRCRVAVTNADDPSIVALYRGFKIERIARRSLVAGDLVGRRSVTELLITSLAE